MKQQISETLDNASEFLRRFQRNEAALSAIAGAAELLTGTLKKGQAVYSCGNGGSMSDAMHFAEELTGRFRQDRRPLNATAISDPGHISCVANDLGFDQVFSRYLQARARPGDCLLAISTSGRSENVIKAAQYGRENGISVIALTGAAGSPLGSEAEIEISVGESPFADRIQEVHIKVIHVLIELIERELFPENYA